MAARALKAVDQFLGGIPPAGAFAIATACLLAVGLVDYLTGYEISFSLFYLVPVAIATWYVGRAGGMAVAVLSCVSWYAADRIAAHPYSHPAIPVWNALVRLGFFAITSLLISTYKGSLAAQRLLARTDPLTGLASRRAFEDILEHDLAMGRRRGTVVSVVYLDLDDFKALNDAHGHAEGDRALCTVGQVLKSSLRETDTVVRMGGDEFAALLPDTDAQGAVKVVTQLVGEMRKAIAENGWRIDCSVGAVTFLKPPESTAAALAAADLAMYDAKRSEKGSVVFRQSGAGG